jgi:hypothetical protein
VKKPLRFQLQILGGQDLPPGCSNVYCQYRLPYPTTQYTTRKVEGGTRDITFNYTQEHTYDYVSETLLNFLLESAICFKIYGNTESGPKLGMPAAPAKGSAKPLSPRPSEDKKAVVNDGKHPEAKSPSKDEGKKDAAANDKPSDKSNPPLAEPPRADKSKLDVLMCIGGCCVIS